MWTWGDVEMPDWWEVDRAAFLELEADFERWKAMLGQKKRCPRCRQRKPLTRRHFYYRPSAGPTYWDTYCKPCKRSLGQEAYQRARQRAAA